MGVIGQRLVILFSACLLLGCGGVARADFIVDDFNAPDQVRVPVIDLVDPDPTHVETPDGAILGGERDLLLDVIGAASPGCFVGEVGRGRLKFNSSSPGTAARLQYDGVDTDVAGPPADLRNSEGLGPIDLAAEGSMFGLEFSSIDGGMAQSTAIQIEVHSSTTTALLDGVIPDSPGLTTFYAPFDAFDVPDPFDVADVFGAVTSIEFRINPGGARDVDFQLQTIDVVTVVPEPSTVVLLAGGLIGLLVYARRRRVA